MGKGIKIKERKKAVRVLDKGAVTAQRLKSALAHTRDKAEHGYYADENSPDAYASDRITSRADELTHEAVSQTGRQGKRLIRATKQSVQKLRIKLQGRREGYVQAQPDSADGVNTTENKTGMAASPKKEAPPPSGRRADKREWHVPPRDNKAPTLNQQPFAQRKQTVNSAVTSGKRTGQVTGKTLERGKRQLSKLQNQ